MFLNNQVNYCSGLLSNWLLANTALQWPSSKTILNYQSCQPVVIALESMCESGSWRWVDPRRLCFVLNRVCSGFTRQAVKSQHVFQPTAALAKKKQNKLRAFFSPLPNVPEAWLRFSETGCKYWWAARADMQPAHIYVWCSSDMSSFTMSILLQRCEKCVQ